MSETCKAQLEEKQVTKQNNFCTAIIKEFMRAK